MRPSSFARACSNFVSKQELRFEEKSPKKSVHFFFKVKSQWGYRGAIRILGATDGHHRFICCEDGGRGKTKGTRDSTDNIESNLERPGILDESYRRRRHEPSRPFTNFSAFERKHNSKSPPREKTNKHWKRRKGSLKAVRWIRAPVDKVEDNRRWSTRRAERAPGTLLLGNMR